MLEDPDNYPTRSRFAPSFLSSYRSAVTLLKVIREDFEAVSHLMLRLWPIWAHALTASVSAFRSHLKLGTSSLINL